MASAADFDPILPTSAEQPPSPLIDLLEEVWRLILKKLTQQEVLNLRVVDSEFKTKVDTLYEDWSIRLDEDSSHFDWILDLRVKEVIVKRLLQPVPNRPVFFKFPDLITNLSFDVDTISGENFSVLLQYKNLKDISIGFGSTSEDAVWPTLDPQIRFNFPELHTLYISVPDDEENKPIENSCYEKFMTQSTMPNLRSLDVNWPLYDRFVDEDYVFECSSILFKFMGQHGQSLKHFAYDNYVQSKHAYEGPRLLNQEALFANCSTLETLKIRDPSYALGDSWDELLRIQSKLIEIDLNCFYTIYSRLCVKIIANNYQTLTKVVIDGLQVERGERVLDISIFSKCVNLRYLKLVNIFSNRKTILNLNTLSKQIETVHLDNLVISAQALSNFFKQFHSLSDIHITGAFEVNLSLYENILKHTALESVFLRFNVPKSQSELARMNEIYSRLVPGKVMYDSIRQNSYLRLKKITDSNGTPMWDVPSR